MAAKKTSAKGLDRRKVVAALVRDRGDALVVTGYPSSCTVAVKLSRSATDSSEQTGKNFKPRASVAIHSVNVCDNNASDGNNTRVLLASIASVIHRAVSVLPVPQAISN